MQLRKDKYIVNLSAEDTPLSARKQYKPSRKGKRLKLHSTIENEVRNPKMGFLEGSSSEQDEERMSYNGDECEQSDDNRDGVRRSKRQRKLQYGTFNTSWIFGTQTVKVCVSLDVSSI